MTSVDSSIGVAFTQIAHSLKKIVEPPTPSRGRKGGGGTSIAIAAGVFNIEDAHLRIASASDQGPIVGMWHEFDREDVGSMARSHSRIQCERSIRRIGLIRIDIQMLVV